MKMILKILLMISIGTTILLLIPDLALPVFTAVDLFFQAEITNFLTAFYAMIPDRLMTLFVMQISTLAIVIMLSWLLGGKSKK